MKLKQHREYRWKDSDYLQDMANHKIEQTMMKSGYDRQQIDEAITKATFSLPEGILEEPEIQVQSKGILAFEDDYFAEQANISDDDFDLTEEDRTYLRLKWGKTYKAEEWIKLEQLYEDMMNSYDVQGAGHVDTLKMVCKTSLKANQLLDIGDVEGAQKMVKMYNELMKSGKFTAAQNKAESGEYVDSISELVALCEKDGFIPRYYTEGPQDKVDRVLQDLQSYTKTLVTEEMNLGNLIEKAVKQIELDRIKEAEESAEAADDEEMMENSLFADENETPLNDEDFEDFRDLEDDWADEDDVYLNTVLGRGGR